MCCFNEQGINKPLVKFELGLRARRRNMKALFFVVAASFALAVGSAYCQSITTTADSTTITIDQIPNAPVPMTEGFSSSTDGFVEAIVPLHPQQPSKPNWFKRNKPEIGYTGAAVLDYLGTAENMMHSIWLCGVNPNIPPGGASISSTSDTAYGFNGVIDTVHAVCGSTANYAYDVSQDHGNFTEGGWAAALGICGNRNTTCVIGSNAAYDVVHIILVKYFEKKGGWKKWLVDATFAYHGEEHVRGGIGNFKFVAENSDPNAWGRNIVGFSANWPTPRWWGN
jgi:hypothetical protein